jgi:hypothetical protein
MAFFKNNTTWLWVIVFIVLIILTFGMKKCENMKEYMTTDCNVCGGYCTCPSCLAQNSIFDDTFISHKEHFSNSPMNMYKEMNVMDTQKSHMETVTGHSDNVHHVTAAPILDNNIYDECEDDNKIVYLPKPELQLVKPSQNVSTVQMYHQNRLDRLRNLAMDLSRNAPVILNKCTPGLLQSLVQIAKSVEPTLTKEFHNLNLLLQKLNKSDMMCVEKQINVPLNKMMCNELNKYDLNELQNNVDDLEYVNEMLKSQKHNFRQMRDLLVVRMKDLVNNCDNIDPVKRKLQIHSINTISEILHSLGYIFQDDTLKSQQKMLNKEKFTGNIENLGEYERIYYNRL